jgi:hypothetical protein
MIDHLTEKCYYVSEMFFYEDMWNLMCRLLWIDRDKDTIKSGISFLVS